MRKAVPLLALIAFACDVLVHGDPDPAAKKPEVTAKSRNDGYQNPHEQFDDAVTPRRSIEDRGRSDEPVGRWRSNGEALEPKWRDGDSVPLLPFSHYRSYPSDDEIDDAEQEDYPATSRRPFKYRYSIDQPNRSRANPDRRVPARDDYDYDYVTYQDRDFDDRDHDYPRNRRRPLKKMHGSRIYEETIKNAASSDGKRDRTIVDASSSDQEVTSRYREAFQARPNEYTHEFDDEEYLRPRPRKRRPPQNYEFALASAAITSEGDEVPRDHSESSQSQPKTIENPPARSSDNNALELKMLLKMQQEEGSSLSEILQRRNLTLSDLLKGKADVINALKSKIADSESEEYIEEMSRMMSNSLMKLAATATPPTTESVQTSTIPESTSTASAVASSTLDNSISVTISALNDATSNGRNKVSNSISRVGKKESDNIEGVTQSVHDSSWPKATTSAIVSTVITTTSTSSPVAVNSMEYFLNDDGNVESTSDQRGAARLENLDEDEIMEFSDFMDFKKGKGQAASTLVNLSNEKIAPPQTSPRNIVSTLSIEHILHPTKQIKLKNSQNNHDAEDDKSVLQSDAQSASFDETFVSEDAFIKAEYPNIPIDIPENDRRQNEEVKYDPNKNENNTLASSIEKQGNLTDDRKESYDNNHSIKYHQVNQSIAEQSRALENHRDTNNKRYEEVVSEIEPEARAEIFELFASGSAGKRLERLLKSRNMSVEELIALRQRGSSKVHLTEVSRLQVPESTNLQTSKISDVNNRETVRNNSNNDLQHLNKDEKSSEKEEDTKNQFRQDVVSYLHDPLFDRDPENTSLSKLLDLVERDKNTSRKITKIQKEDQKDTSSTNRHTELENPRHSADIIDLLTSFGSLPFAEDVQRQFETEFDNEAEAKPPIVTDKANVVLIDDEENVVRSDNTSDEFHVGYVEEIIKKEPKESSIMRTIYSETTSDEEENKTLLRVKPSIIASGVILGVTIIVFLTIFTICRIRQKQRYTYRNTFSRTVFQNSIAAARKLSNSSSLSTVMVNVAATSTTKRPEKTEMQEAMEEFDDMDMDNDSLDANDSWETIPDYAK